jgi:hypothetical protein
MSWAGAVGNYLTQRDGAYSGEAKPHADVYVFCLLHHTDKLTVDPLNLNQWEFYILATKQLEGFKGIKQIMLRSLQNITKAVLYDGLYDEIKSKMV